MAVSIVQLGTERKHQNELRLGTVRRPPRGVKKTDYSKLNFYDLWIPILSPSAELMKIGKESSSEADWLKFKKKFKAELSKGDAMIIIELIALMSHQMEVSMGCYCQDESRCHRSVLRELLKEKKAKILN